MGFIYETRKSGVGGPRLLGLRWAVWIARRGVRLIRGSAAKSDAPGSATSGLRGRGISRLFKPQARVCCRNGV